MKKRYVKIWFRYLRTDAMSIRQPRLRALPFVLTANDHGRKLIVAANATAEVQGIHTGMVLADARALVKNIEAKDDDPAATQKILNRLARWFIRYTPLVVVDEPDGLILDATGCPHLWGGERAYLDDIGTRLHNFGFTVQLAMADTIGAAWALAHYGHAGTIVPPGEQLRAMLPLPPESLRLEPAVCERLQKLGLRQVKDFIHLPRHSLRRRFGEDCIRNIHYALGYEEEIRTPLFLPDAWQERLPCLEPIVTATGIGIALERMLEALCTRLRKEGKGLRSALFTGYRMDGKTVSLQIGTHQPTHHEIHLYKLFELKFGELAPGPGIELFTLDAPKVEETHATQTQLWGGVAEGMDDRLSELLDRVTAKYGEGHFHRYLPDEHYWPERSVRPAASLMEKTKLSWKTERPRPLQLLAQPERIEVTAPIPDYPPMNFRHKGQLHKVMKADGPERIEQEWWQQQGEHRDYYCLEDEEGRRYWVFRSGHYKTDAKAAWYLHGYFA